MTTTRPQAPDAPGRLGQAIPAEELLAYLSALDAWLRDRRAELDRLDAAGRASTAPDQHTSDLVLALSMWQLIRTRTDELVRTWDSGRVGEVERERMSRLIWGRLDPSEGSAGVSLVEAVTLCDALVRQLRVRLAFDPATADHVARLRALRAALVRCEDLVGGDPAARDRLARLREREQAMVAQTARGADVSGPLAELETEVARTERDLIVEASERTTLARHRQDATELAAALEAREPTLHELAERCRREIVNPPRLAVPDVSRLGEAPEGREALDTYLHRLQAVRRALDHAAEAYTAPLRLRAELRYRLDNLHDAADANGRSSSPTVRSGYDEARAAVDATPCDVVLAQFLVEQYEFLTRPLPRGGAAARPEGAS